MGYWNKKTKTADWFEKWNNEAVLKNNKITIRDYYQNASRSGLMKYEEIAEILNNFLKFEMNDVVLDVGGSSGGLSMELYLHCTTHFSCGCFL